MPHDGLHLVGMVRERVLTCLGSHVPDLYCVVGRTTGEG